jgi:hypothetical protein
MVNVPFETKQLTDSFLHDLRGEKMRTLQNISF